MFLCRNGWRKKVWVSRSPVWASSSFTVLGLAALMLYTVQRLSSPPLATRFPEGAKATLITQADFNGTATSCERESFLQQILEKLQPGNKYILTLKLSAKNVQIWTWFWAREWKNNERDLKFGLMWFSVENQKFLHNVHSTDWSATLDCKIKWNLFLTRAWKSTLFPVNVSQMRSLPSCDALTICLTEMT